MFTHMIRSGDGEPEGVGAGRKEVGGASTVVLPPSDETDDGVMSKAIVIGRLRNPLRDKGYRRVDHDENEDGEPNGTEMLHSSSIGGGRILVPASEEVWEDDIVEGESKAPLGSLEIDSSPASSCGDDKLNPPAELIAARRILLLSHLFACSAEVTYQFVLIIFLSRLATDSLFLVSSYGLVTGLLVFLCGGRAGRYLDETERLGAIRLVLLCQSLCIVMCTVACYAILVLHGEVDDGESIENDADTDNAGYGSSWMPTPLQHYLRGVPLDIPTVVALICVHLSGASTEVFSQASTVAIEKDWVVVIAGGSAEFLRRINVAMRQIDLTCKMLGPAAAGFSLVAVGERLRPAILLVGIVNAIAVIVEYASLSRIFRLVPDLSRERCGGGEGVTSSETLEETSSETLEEGDDSCRDDQRCRRFGCISTEMKAYFSQTVAPGGIALALLYINVLSVGELMTSYLLWRGMRVDMLGIWRGVASIIGLLGTITFKLSSSRLSLRVTSMWSIALFFSCLTVCYLSLFARNNRVALTMLVLGVCISRVGLWTFDMSITQLMQETVPEASRGVVGGTQHSLQAFFFGIHFVLGLVWPNPEQFHILVGVGYAAVGMATVLVFWGVLLNRRIQV